MVAQRVSKPINTLLTPRRHIDDRGTLVCHEVGRHIPFDVRSVVYTCDVPPDARRGGHAHVNLHQFIKCASGSVTVSTMSQSGVTETVLTESADGIYIPPMTWSEQYDHTPGTLVLVFSSEHYDESDYIRDINHFKSMLVPMTSVPVSNDESS